MRARRDRDPAIGDRRDPVQGRQDRGVQGGVLTGKGAWRDRARFGFCQAVNWSPRMRHTLPTRWAGSAMKPRHIPLALLVAHHLGLLPTSWSSALGLGEFPAGSVSAAPRSTSPCRPRCSASVSGAICRDWHAAATVAPLLACWCRSSAPGSAARCWAKSSARAGCSAGARFCSASLPLPCHSACELVESSLVKWRSSSWRNDKRSYLAKILFHSILTRSDLFFS